MVHSGKRDVPLQSPDRRRQQIALAGEQLAAQYLVQRGYQPVCQNWRSGRFAELDLVFRHSDGTIVMVEVKTRRGPADANTLQAAFESINWRKRRKILIAARSFLATQARASCGLRIDVVVICFTDCLVRAGKMELQNVQIYHVPEAFTDV